jgi:hypothetical protein
MRTTTFGASGRRCSSPSGAPPRFDSLIVPATPLHRSGWTFTADPARAPEFLDVNDASAAGLTLTGSGTETVTTAALFHPHELVLVDGADAFAAFLRADNEGRLAFSVRLGPAHSLEEGTAEQVAAASADADYFVTRHVRFLRWDDL